VRHRTLVAVCLLLLGCAPRLVRQPVTRATLAGGLEVAYERSAPPPVLLKLRATGPGPVVVTAVRRIDQAGQERDAVVLVRESAPGLLRYLRDEDVLVADPRGGARSAPSLEFLWYELVLYPGGEQAQFALAQTGQAETPGEVGVVLEYFPMSYYRLARSGYVTVGQTGDPEGPDRGPVRFHRISEQAMRTSRPSKLFLRSGSLPRRISVPIQIPLTPGARGRQ